jgi:hypothetical protein
MVLSGVLKDCKKKINKDLTLIKPIEAVPNIEVPAFYMVGKGDIIARPEKVKELYLHTKSKKKEYHTFEGEHPSHRDKYILKKGILFILNEFDKLGLQKVPSTIPKPALETKKDKQQYKKRLYEEHKTETFVDPPVKMSNKPVKPPSEDEEMVPLSMNEIKSNKVDPQNASFKNIKEEGIPMKSSENPVPVQPKQDIESISNNLVQTKQENTFDIPKDIEKQPLAMSFSENAPPIEFNKKADIGEEATSMANGLNKSPIVTGNSSPQ